MSCITCNKKHNLYIVNTPRKAILLRITEELVNLKINFMHTEKFFKSKKDDLLRLIEATPLLPKTVIEQLLDVNRATLTTYLTELHKDNLVFPNKKETKLRIAQYLAKSLQQPNHTEEKKILFDELFSLELRAYLKGAAMTIKKYRKLFWDQSQVSQSQFMLCQKIYEQVQRYNSEDVYSWDDMISYWLESCYLGNFPWPDAQAFSNDAWWDDIIQCTLHIDRKEVAPYVDANFWQAIEAEFKKLTHRQQQMISMYFGLDGQEKMNFKHIAEHSEHTSNRVTQWFHQGMHELCKATSSYFASVAQGMQIQTQLQKKYQEELVYQNNFVSKTTAELRDNYWETQLHDLLGMTTEIDPYPVPEIRGKILVLLGNSPAQATTAFQKLLPDALLHPLTAYDLGVRGYTCVQASLNYNAPWVRKWKETGGTYWESQSPFLWELAAQDPWELRKFRNVGKKTVALFEELLASNGLQFNTKFTEEQIEYLVRHTYGKK